MKLKIENISELLKSGESVEVSYDSFKDDMSSLMNYYIRNEKDSYLGKLAIQGDISVFGLAYLSQRIFGNPDSIFRLESSEDKIKMLAI